MIVGPSRIGKTSIAEEFETELNPKSESELLSRRPVVRLVCRNRGDKGSFTSKGFYLDALSIIDHPFYKVDGPDMESNHEMIRRLDRETTTTLQAVFENALKLLRTKYLVIDETQHLMYMHGGEKSTLQMLEFFKTLAERLQLTLIFIGAYPIVNVMELSPHMLGRLTTIEMPRYTMDTESSLAKFHEILNWYSKDMQFEKGVSSLVDWNRLLYEGSLGVIGLLSAWLRDAMSEMLSNGEHRLSLTHLMYARKPQNYLDEMAEEIIEGENYLKGIVKGRTKDAGKSTRQKKADAKKRKAASPPFQAKVKRRKQGGRS